MTDAGSETDKARSGLFLGSLPPWLSTAAPVVLLSLFVLWSVHAGMSAMHALTAVLAIVVTQVIPGAVIWRAVRPRNGWVLEDLAVGFVLGSLLAIGAQIPAGLLGWRWLSAVLCVGVAALLMSVPSIRSRVISARTTPLPWWWGSAAVVSALYAVEPLRGFIRTNLLSWRDGSFHTSYVDMNLHISLAGQLLERGPTKFPWVQSEPLGYHYLSHAWMAQVAATSGAGVDEIVLRFMPLLFPVIIALTVAVVAHRLTGVLWAGPLAAFLTFAIGGANSMGVIVSQAPLTPYSPSVAPSAGMLLVLFLVIVMRWRGELPRVSLLLVFLLAIGAAGAKGSTTPLVVAGVAAALGAMVLFDRTKVRAVIPDLVAVIAGLLVAVKVVFRDSEAGLHLSLHDSAQQTWVASRLTHVDTVPLELVASGVAILAALTAGVLTLAFVFVPDLRRRPEMWLLGAASLAGAGAVGAFAHPGKSQGYFAVSAKPLLALGSVFVAVELYRLIARSDLLKLLTVALLGGLAFEFAVPGLLGGSIGHRDVLIRLFAGAVVLIVVGLVAAFLVTTQRLTLAFVGICVALIVSGVAVNARQQFSQLPAGNKSVSPQSPLAESMQEINAARWIRDHSNRDDLVITNKHCTSSLADPLPGCDSRHFVVTAYSQRQVLVEGWTATPRSVAVAPNGRDSITVAYWRPDLLQLNDGFIASPTQAGADALRRLGVRWIFADRTRPRSDAIGSFATLRFHNRDVNVYELR